MFNPAATYRIQFHKGFTFRDFDRIIPYLSRLGVSTVYASPIFKAVPGSTHGYNTVDPLQINPEIGTLDELKKLSRKLKKKNICWIQDIVPNHMAFHADNAWLMDVLEKGNRSAFYDFFDQVTGGNLYKGPLMVPFLGSDLDQVIKNKELKIEWFDQQLCFNYAGNRYPLNPDAYLIILNAVTIKQPEALGPLLYEIHQIRNITDPDEFSAAWNNFKQSLNLLISAKSARTFFKRIYTKVNANGRLLRQISDQQFYRLCSWQETDHTINYRRFFTVNGLICLNIQRPEVFDHFHSLIKSLVKEDIFQGLRIDHIDGLYDPTKYLEQLRDLAGQDTYIIVEKILEAGEVMPSEWPVQGNTGYDFLGQVNNLFTNTKSEARFTAFYKQLTGDDQPVHQQIAQKKAMILSKHMAGELDNLTRLLIDSELMTEDERTDISFEVIKQALGEFLVSCPVYRFYGNQLPLSHGEHQAVKQILKHIGKHKAELLPGVELLKKIWLKRPQKMDDRYNERALHFYQRCMQFTGPLMAKGVEDTLMYTYNRFIDHNEVGDSPEVFGIKAVDFHTQMINRQKHWPLSMNGTSTHDTKRGEDVRARLNVLSDLSEEWIKTVESWQQMNASLKIDGSPDANDELFIYQTMIGAYPMPGEGSDHFAQRMEEYLEKTLREAKLHSNWAAPNVPYETAVKQFVKILLEKKRPFWKSFTTFHQKVSDFGLVNSLAQVLLKFTCPGVPDVYQGCEHWDLSLVDPDNRRPVKYDKLDHLLKSTASADNLWKDRFDGHIKLSLVNTLLKERRANHNLFCEGEYIPLKIKGAYHDHVMAFARVYKNNWYITAVPLHIADLCSLQNKKVNEVDWQNTRIVLPKEVPGIAENLLLKRKEKFTGEIKVADLFKSMPVALIRFSHPQNNRKAGILLPVSSLPSDFGVGDFGPGARRFVDLLHASDQHYWQLLPISPVTAKEQYSPYSSPASFAGNELLISPELLVDEGLLNSRDLDDVKLDHKSKADYTSAKKIKRQLFEKAWVGFQSNDAPHLTAPFDAFRKQEAYWLDDYALYQVLKTQHGGQPWHRWSDDLRSRSPEALAAFEKEHENAVNKNRWIQFVFARQWEQLKDYCHQKEIKLFGDLPFYVSYDSVDVWANPDLFSLNNAGKMTEVAGVPPDYFNADGQLWGMPVFNWAKLKSRNYDWWIQRIKKNLQNYDLLRLDHFRAFSSYWAVPADEKTAIKGIWKKAPGLDFFKVLKEQLGELPLVAEDLGDIDDAVYLLRDEFKLPGMKVLQFAFGGDLHDSPHIPHNYAERFIAYTGTHDNNTTRGWYTQDIDKATRKHISKYLGLKVDENNVSKILIKQALSSVAETVIIPMQDWLDLDERARINVPAAIENNWLWRLKQADLKDFPLKKARRWMERYGRI